jgi:hypothetical protein
MGELAQGPWKSLAGRDTPERELGRGGRTVVHRRNPRIQQLVEATA